MSSQTPRSAVRPVGYQPISDAVAASVSTNTFSPDIIPHVPSHEKDAVPPALELGRSCSDQFEAALQHFDVAGTTATTAEPTGATTPGCTPVSGQGLGQVQRFVLTGMCTADRGTYARFDVNLWLLVAVPLLASQALSYPAIAGLR